MPAAGTAAVDWDWDRAGRSDDGRPVRCLWLRGFLTDRSAHRASLGLAAVASDAAIVEACVERYGGRAAAARLGGSLAWVVWDRVHGVLVACRDRAGLQPLFYVRAGRRIFVDPGASALVAAAGLSREPDPLATAAHLAGRFPPADRSWLRGVPAVPPAHVLELRDGGLALHRYWSADEGQQPPVPASAAAAEVAGLLRTVVTETMPAEGFALTLSSGLDSGALAMAWRQVHPQAELDAVLWSSPELPAAEEAPLARRVAQDLGLRAHLVRADRHWPLSARGEPLGLEDSPFVPFYAEVWEETFRLTRQLGAAGLATGAGGDHLFGYGGVGAYTYLDLLVRGRWPELVRQVRDHHRVSPASLLRILDLDLLRPLAHLVLPRRGRPPAPWLGPLARRELRHLGPTRTSARGGGLPSRRHRLTVLSDPAVATLLADFGVRARRHGIELRHPLLDHRLIELAARLPGEVCFRSGYYKVVLRDVVRGHLPADVVERRSKVTPEAIFDRGLRERQVAEVWSLLTGMRSAQSGWVDESALRADFNRYLASGKGGGRLWAALTLEHWLRRYF